ncbi:hypothetical protein WN51_10297 [Melipona quadrifasciata]|uniref:Uncharacterized protein n=1 Tax=Melipona quadrifasciata TaxID=166423 RepID=A0A0M9A4R5_9HYME|nr:hypothetical protein WN51_10297 [Melipona quadrifasciata]
MPYYSRNASLNWKIMGRADEKSKLRVKLILGREISSELSKIMNARNILNSIVKYNRHYQIIPNNVNAKFQGISCLSTQNREDQRAQHGQEEISIGEQAISYVHRPQLPAERLAATVPEIRGAERKAMTMELIPGSADLIKQTSINNPSGAIAQYQTTPLLLKVYATPPRESRDPNQPMGEKRVTRDWTDKAQRWLVNFAREMKKMLENKMSGVADK